jgi:hypothetical protein
MLMAQQTNITNLDILNRFGYHSPTEVTGAQHQMIREEFITLAHFLNETLPEGRAKSVALTELENAAMWANKSVATQAPLVVDK